MVPRGRNELRRSSSVPRVCAGGAVACFAPPRPCRKQAPKREKANPFGAAKAVDSAKLYADRKAAEAEKAHGEAFALLDSIGQPTIAMLHGHVLGGGLGLSLYHDFRIAARTARAPPSSARATAAAGWALPQALAVAAYSRWKASSRP